MNGNLQRPSPVYYYNRVYAPLCNHIVIMRVPRSRWPPRGVIYTYSMRCIRAGSTISNEYLFQIFSLRVFQANATWHGSGE